MWGSTFEAVREKRTSKACDRASGRDGFRCLGCSTGRESDILRVLLGHVGQMGHTSWMSRV